MRRKFTGAKQTADDANRSLRSLKRSEKSELHPNLSRDAKLRMHANDTNGYEIRNE